MIKRRKALTIAAGAICCHSAAFGQPTYTGRHGPAVFGCCIPASLAPQYLSRATGGEVYESGNERLVSNSASRELDYALAQTLAMLCHRFEILPGFSYYQELESDGHNALATERTLLSRSDGTVLFGLGMLGDLLGKDQYGAAAVVAVAAHEFGHIVAMKRGINDSLAPDKTNPFRAEQFADFMSGAFAGMRFHEDSTFPAVVFATTMRSFGGGVHGTGEQRGHAVTEGFKAAIDGSSNINDLVMTGRKFSMSVSQSG